MYTASLIARPWYAAHRNGDIMGSETEQTGLIDHLSTHTRTHHTCTHARTHHTHTHTHERTHARTRTHAHTLSQAFAWCSLLKDVWSSESVEKIDRHAFLDCVQLRSLAVSYQVQIDVSAFAGCTSLKTLFIKSEYSDSGGGSGDDIDLHFKLLARFPHLTCLWASDKIIRLASGPFEDFQTYADLPPELRVSNQ